MTRDAEILNLLLDRYERSGHCLPGKSSNRRIALAMARGEYAPYRENDPCAVEVNTVIQAMAKEGLVSFDWRKGYEGWLLDKVYLELSSLPRAYAKAGRMPLTDTATALLGLLQQAKVSIKTPWKLRFLEEESSKLQKSLRPSRLLPEDVTQAEAILNVLQYTERGPELMRVISSNCFHDSKYLERYLLSSLASIARAYEPELAAYRSIEEELLTQSVVLVQLGVLTYPEIFEFCGKIQLIFSGSVFETCMFQKGFCLQSNNLDLLNGIVLRNINTVLFVENRTNYRHLILRGIPDDMLLVYHGGFYSPTKRRLFQMLAKDIPSTAEVLFWGDIDLGGFLMFTRLKKDIFPNLVPYRMGPTDYEMYKSFGTKRKSAYFTSLQQRMEEGIFDSIFFSVALAILENGITVEQEIMLS